MADWVEIIWKAGALIALLAVTVYISRANAKTLKEKVLPELEAIKINLTAINLHLAGVMELKKRSDDDHDKVVVLIEKTGGLQAGLNSVRNEIKKQRG